jgi:hypothetical protein
MTMRVWIDIDNPPQVQYLLPFKGAFEQAGAETVLTARDYGSTLRLLADAGVEAAVFGTILGRSKSRKLLALVRRTREFGRFFAEHGPPDILLAASRPSAVAARRLGIPSFIVGDYEWANVSVYRWTGSTMLYPDVIDSEVFLRRGLSRHQLQPFRGLKEDISFAGIDVDAVPTWEPDGRADGAVRVLFRPPSETSHYYRRESSAMAASALRRLAELDVHVVFSPREPYQTSYLEGLPWAYEPTVLERPVHFISLLKGVDAVVCSGGTMLREAAYLGIPAYSILQSAIGGVDRWLAEIGRVVLVERPEELERIGPTRRDALDPLVGNSNLLSDLVDLILGTAVAVRRPLAAPGGPRVGRSPQDGAARQEVAGAG